MSSRLSTLQGSIGCLSYRTRVERVWKVILQACVTLPLLMITNFPTHHLFYLCSVRVGAYVSTCQEWTRLSLFTVPCLSPIYVLSHRPDDLCFSEEDSDLVCQPGVGWMEINETLKEKGIPLFFPVRVKYRTRLKLS